MRPAPSDDSPSNGEPLPEHGPTSGPSATHRNSRLPRRPQWWVVRIGAAVVALMLIGGGAFFLFGRRGTPIANPSHPPPSTSPPAPPRQSFVFPLTTTSSVPTGKRNADAARVAATRIQSTLSAFYDTAFMDPTTWKHGVPARAWTAFDKTVQEHARADADALTLGEAGSRIDRLSVTQASLSVRVLLDPSGRPQAAVATVSFDASGRLTGGEDVEVSSRGSFLLRPSGERWLVVGYPSVSTQVDAGSPSPTPSASGSAQPSGSASPSSGASP